MFDNNNNRVGGQVGLNTGGLAGFVGQFIDPIEINAMISAGRPVTRVVIGGGTDATLRHQSRSVLSINRPMRHGSCADLDTGHA